MRPAQEPVDSLGVATSRHSNYRAGRFILMTKLPLRLGLATTTWIAPGVC